MAFSSAPEPYVFLPSQGFQGNDGLWSTFIVRIGSPAQEFRILPYTNSDNIILPLADGCAGEDVVSGTLCGSLRGAMVSNSRDSVGLVINSSTTWRNIGLFSLLLGQQWGMQGRAQFGYDTVGLAAQNSGGPTLDDQIVAGITKMEPFMGGFPLGVMPTRFSTFEHPQPSYLVSLKNRGIIPGLGFGYNAGAHYRYSGVTGSLVIGGYDASRFDSESTKTFTFGHDDNDKFTVGVGNITAVGTLQDSVSLLTECITASIDSTLPYLWLPTEVCDRFQAAFGLAYDAHSQMYLVNDTIHNRLKQLNPKISLTLRDSPDTGDIVLIDLPYAAFDLQASWPLMENKTNYFPLRRAANSSQYTLGRTFLQEVYLGVDYERRIFNVSQANFASPMPEQQIIPVEPESNTMGRFHPSRLSLAAKLGIGFGIAGVVILIMLVRLFCYLLTHDTKPCPSRVLFCADAATVTATTARKAVASTEVFEIRPKEADSQELYPDNGAHKMV